MLNEKLEYLNSSSSAELRKLININNFFKCSCQRIWTPFGPQIPKKNNYPFPLTLL